MSALQKIGVRVAPRLTVLRGVGLPPVDVKLDGDTLWVCLLSISLSSLLSFLQSSCCFVSLSFLSLPFLLFPFRVYCLLLLFVSNSLICLLHSLFCLCSSYFTFLSSVWCCHHAPIASHSLQVNGSCLTKPFVEKPVDAEDHNVTIYYSAEQGGGGRRLFRKVKNQSSIASNENNIRWNGSYIYEKVSPTARANVL